MNTTAVQSPNLLKRAVLVLTVGLGALIAVAAVSLLSLIDDPGDNVDAVYEIVAASSKESTAATNRYLDTAESAGAMAERSLAFAGGSLRDVRISATLRNIVAEHDSVDGALVGLPSGDFVSVSKALVTVDGGYRIKIIENADLPDRRVVEQQTNSMFDLVDEVELPTDSFDPRGRPWYVAALEREQGWIGPYISSSSGESSITHFRSLISDGDLIAVIAIDVRLSEISAFLEPRQPSDSGVTAIVSDDGSVITDPPSELDPELVQQLAELTRDVDPETPLLMQWSTESELNVAALARVGSGDEWTLAVVAPQNDFVTDLDRQAARFRDLIPAAAIVLALAVVAVAAWALRRIDRLHDDATSDPLTGLLNRTAVRERFALLLEESPDKLIAAIAIDVDDFKEINDNWGRLAGDQALLEFTRRLNERIGSEGFAGRLGGDEFLAAWEVKNSSIALADITEMVGSLSHPPIDIDGASLQLSVSCGYSLREPGESIDLVNLLRNADLALLTAKSQTETVVQFDTEMVLPSIRDQELTAKLVSAIERNEFEIHFQPEVDMSNGSVIGAEALLRWRLTDGSFVAAKEFIEDLERLQVLDLLTPLLLRQAEALAEKVGDPEFTVRLNFGSDQLRNHATLDAIAEASERTAVGWCLEITERTIIESDLPTLKSLDELVTKGVTLALDDFGTGYSSLAELGNLPISTVKIDRSFVKTLTLENAASSLVSIIHDMAEKLSLAVVAEGIETEEQRQALFSIGCRHGQGWLFGAAMPMESFLVNASLSHKGDRPSDPTLAL